jgi:hypothetical protein
MAFTKIPPKSVAPASPDLLFRELPRRKFPDVLPHQQAMMQRYAAEAENISDVALQLPTGSGKTLVGLLIAEWRRRKYKEKIVYLCPTRQLVHQAVAQAEQKYGLSVVGFTGSRRDYPAGDKAKYNQADSVAITTYSSLFNTNPYFSDADVIIVDDAHAAENYVAKLWTVSISRHVDSHTTLHSVLSEAFRKYIDGTTYSRLTGQWDSPADLAWVDKLPTPIVMELHNEIIGILDAYTKDIDLRYPWSMVRNHLLSCHVYLSGSEIVIRPIIAPTWDHPAFDNAKQRIYMSATLGEGGDLERLMGRKRILRLPIPDGWDLQGVGRRFFIFPSLSLDSDDELQLRRNLMKKAPRSLVLVPSGYMEKEISNDIDTNLSLTVYSAEDIEQSKDNFIRSSGSVAVVANRYDGIDFPGDECRLLFIEGLPKAVNAQERFIMSRMGANVLFNERIQTRVLQAIGRCTRSLEDYSAVVVTGEELPDYLSDPRRRRYFHPELQAELWFGVEQSKEKSIADFTDNFYVFIENGEDWESVNQAIVDQRNASIKSPFPSIEQLAEAVECEVQYQISMWQEDHVEALDSAESVIGLLTDPELRGYRVLWEYLAGSAAVLAATRGGNDSFNAKAREHYSRAKKAAKGIPWLVQLSQQLATGEVNYEEDVRNKLLMTQVENIEAVLSALGVTHDRKYSKSERAILEGLNEVETFERAHKLLGEHIGFEAGKVEVDASPDPWWQLGQLCLVFEDHANAGEHSSIDATKARQAASHPTWMKDNVASCQAEEVEIAPVLITPVSYACAGAMPHLGSVSLWKLSDFQEWAKNAMATVRQLRKTFVEPGDLVWRAQAADSLIDNQMDMLSLVQNSKARVAKDLLVERDC